MFLWILYEQKLSLIILPVSVNIWSTKYLNKVSFILQWVIDYDMFFFNAALYYSNINFLSGFPHAITEKKNYKINMYIHTVLCYSMDQDMITDFFVKQKHCRKKKLTKTFRVITKNSTFLFTDKYNKNLNQITNITQSKQ